MKIHLKNMIFVLNPGCILNKILIKNILLRKIYIKQPLSCGDINSFLFASTVNKLAWAYAHCILMVLMLDFNPEIGAYVRSIL